MSDQPVKVVHLMTTPGGGAARAGINLHLGICKHREVGVSSDILYLEAENPGENASVFVRPSGGLFGLRRSISRAIHRLEFRPFRKWQRRSGQARWERFSSVQAGWGEALAKAVGGFDIVHLHWVADFVDLKPFLEALPERVRVVWTLHDLWAFTGGCHFPEGCVRYRESCGACPQWGSVDVDDYSRKGWRERQAAYGSLDDRRLRIVAPSQWMAQRAGESSLFGQRQIEVIPNGIDLGVFQPVPRQEARQLLALPEDAFVALFLADSGGNRRKGFAVLEEALAGFPAGSRRILLVVGGAETKPVPGWEVISIGYVGEVDRLAAIYSAADVFVHPALEDNLPSTVLESLACGTPVAAFRIGGLPELITSDSLGALGESTSSAAMRDLLLDRSRWTSDPARRLDCRRHAEKFSIDTMVERYLQVYRSLG